MKFKKIISLALVSATVCGMLAGCQPKETPTIATETKKTEGTTADSTKKDDTAKVEEVDKYAPIADKKYKISTASNAIQQPEADGIIKKALEEKYNVELDMWYIDDSKWDELLNVRLASGDVPDLFRVRKPNMLTGYIKQGVLAEVPLEVYQKYMPGWAKAMDELAPEYLTTATVNGINYGIPDINPTNIFRIPLVYNQTWLDKVGITKTPETFEEFQDAMYKFANDDPDGNGKKDTYGLSLDGFNAVYGSNGAVVDKDNFYFVEEDGQFVDSATSKGLRTSLETLAKWYKDGVVEPEFLTGENTGGYWAISHQFVKGSIGFTTRGNFYHWIPKGLFDQTFVGGVVKPVDSGAVAKELELVKPGTKLAFGSTIKGENSAGGIKQWNMLQGYYGMGKLTEKEPDKIGKILSVFDDIEFQLPQDERNFFKFGVKDLHWTYVSEERNVQEAIAPFNDEKGYNHRLGGLQLKLGSPIMEQKDQNLWAIETKQDEGGIQSLVPVGLESFAKYRGDLFKLRDQMIIEIITGAKPIEAFDEYVAAYNAAGGKVVYDEAKAWYDASK